MPHFPQALPTDSGAVGDLARQLALLIGPSLQPGDGTLAAIELLALAGGLNTSRTTTENAILEAFVDSANQLLSELETEYGLPARPDATNASRQSALAARVKAWSGSVQRLDSVVSTLDGVTSDVFEATPATVGSAIDVFRFGVHLTSSANYQNTALIAQLDEQLDATAPAHTNWQYGNNATGGVGFFTDDPNSLTDMTLLAS